MRGLISSILLVTLTVMVIIVVSCAREEKPVPETPKVAKPAPPPGTVTTETPEPPPKKPGPPPVDEIALRPSQRQTVDIMSGNPVKSNIYADYKGKRIYFCCDESKRKFELDSEAWMKRAEELGMVLQDSPAK